MENTFFNLSAWKSIEYFATKLGRRDYVGEIYNLQIWCRSVAKWRLHTVVKYNGFVTFFSHFFFFFFRFFGQPTGRNFSPNCTLNGSKVVLRLIYVPFGGLVPSNSL